MTPGAPPPTWCAGQGARLCPQERLGPRRRPVGRPGCAGLQFGIDDEAAVDEERCRSDVARVVGEHEGDGPGHLLGLTGPMERDPILVVRDRRWIVEEAAMIRR
jgi:hypothetical protein